jgi:cell division protein ZapA
MGQVNVIINGRQFRMGCEDGQEEHLMKLARELDTRIEGLRVKFGEIGDSRLTVMAALTIADELSELGGRVKRLEQEVAAARDAHTAHADRNHAAQAAIAAALAAAAERIEGVTKKLNHRAAGGSVALG